MLLNFHFLPCDCGEMHAFCSVLDSDTIASPRLAEFGKFNYPLLGNGGLKRLSQDMKPGDINIMYGPTLADKA